MGCELPNQNIDIADSIKAEHNEMSGDRDERMDVESSHLENRINHPIPMAAMSHDSRAQFVSLMQSMDAPFSMPRRPLGYKCDKCGRRFAKKSNMKKHRELHSDDLPNFECWLCHKK